MSKDRPRFSRLGVLAPAALSACIDASVLAAPAAGAILSTVLKELSKAFMLKKWFHGVMTAEEAEKLLMQRGKNGSYLVRESQTYPGEFVLSVRVRGRVSHVMIRREHEKYDVGSGESFDDLTSLIEHCRAYPLTETSGDVLRLLQPVSGSRMNQPDVQLSAALEIKNTEQMEVDTPVAEYDDSAMVNEPTIGNGFYGDFVGGGFDAEFRALNVVEATTNFTTVEGNRRENQHKNRYRNVIPYDQTRVVLPRNMYTLDDAFSDYINASFIRPLKTFEGLPTNSSASSSNDSLCCAKLASSALNAMQPMETSSLVTKSLSEEALREAKKNMKMDSATRNKILAGVALNEPMETSPLVSKSLSEEALREAKKNMKIDYATGNKIPAGVVRDKFYIAAQGSLRSTVHAFWHMIVHHDVQVIAMITNTVENGRKKCAKYWPDAGEQECYGDIKILSLRELSHSVYKLREFEVTTDKKRSIVYQYQFRTWPDHCTPADTNDILTYLDDINELMLKISNGENPPKNNIMCVHCSAGIGRTGTFIALDMLVDQVKTEGLDVHIDIHKTVKVCRFQRAGMVQNKLQYKFLYLAMNDYLNEAKAKANRVAYYGSMDEHF